MLWFRKSGGLLPLHLWHIRCQFHPILSGIRIFCASGAPNLNFSCVLRDLRTQHNSQSEFLCIVHSSDACVIEHQDSADFAAPIRNIHFPNSRDQTSYFREEACTPATFCLWMAALQAYFQFNTTCVGNCVSYAFKACQTGWLGLAPGHTQRLLCLGGPFAHDWIRLRWSSLLTLFLSKV